jgi:hypothetical protein
MVHKKAAKATRAMKAPETMKNKPSVTMHRTYQTNRVMSAARAQLAAAATAAAAAAAEAAADVENVTLVIDLDVAGCGSPRDVACEYVVEGLWHDADDKSGSGLTRSDEDEGEEGDCSSNQPIDGGGQQVIERVGSLASPSNRELDRLVIRRGRLIIRDRFGHLAVKPDGTMYFCEDGCSH